MRLFEGKNDREREREPKKNQERERERERASWMPNDMETAGNRAPQVEFSSSVLPVLWLCTTVFAWFTPSLMDCYVWSQVIAFGGGLSLYSVSCTSLTKNSCNSKVVFKHFHRDSNIIWTHTKTGWWFQPLWKIVVWDYYSQSMDK